MLAHIPFRVVPYVRLNRNVARSEGAQHLHALLRANKIFDHHRRGPVGARAEVVVDAEALREGHERAEDVRGSEPNCEKDSHEM